MVGIAILISLVCLIAGLRCITFFVCGDRDDPKRWYVLGKGFVILYLGAMYGIVAVDFWFDIVKYPIYLQTTIGQMLRIAALVTSFVFLTDSWIRKQ